MEEKERRLAQEGRSIARACLMAICADGEARHADRIAAAKLLLEGMEEEGGGSICVMMEGIPKEYLA